MAVSRALRRLLRIRDLEEEQCRLTLESALGELNRMEHALAATVERERRGRSLVQESARTGELRDRLVGLEERCAAERFTQALTPWIAQTEIEVAERRQEYLTKRVERRQAETLIQETEAREAIEAGRRGQQSLDDWYSSRQHRKNSGDAPDSESARSTAAGIGSQRFVVSEEASGEESCAGKES